MRIGIDIGGTFTDAVAVSDEGAILVAKTPSTSDDPARAVLDALKLLADRLQISVPSLYARTELLIHGTTVATNILAERKGAHVGMICTRGFRDLLELREGTKSNRYNLHSEFPQPLIQRPFRIEIAERIIVTKSTVKFHVSSILSKLQAATRTEAVALAPGGRFDLIFLDPPYDLATDAVERIVSPAWSR